MNEDSPRSTPDDGAERAPDPTEVTASWMPPTELPTPHPVVRPQSYRLSKGDRIGPYTLKRGLGIGGFGEVWLAERRNPDLTVAIKVLRPEVADKRSRGRFEAEAQALSLLSHEGIASIHEAGVTERGEPYIAMQYVEGVPLTRYCDTKRMSLDQRMELMSLVCEAVHHAHTRGIIHRDLKPDNILVTEVRRDVAAVEGRDRLLIVGKDRDQAILARPKILDFGLAKAINRNMRLTEQTLTEDLGKLMGTLEYMAPEQTAHEPLAVDTRADIFALGVMTYELIAGVLPLPKEELVNKAIDDAVRRVRGTPRPDPSTRFSSLDAELSAQVAALRGELAPDRLARVLKGRVRHLVGKALRLEPERRFTSTAAMARDIRHYLDEEPFEEAAAERVRERVWLAVKRRPLPYTAALFFLVALIGGITALVWAVSLRAQADSLLAQLAVFTQIQDHAFGLDEESVDDLIALGTPNEVYEALGKRFIEAVEDAQAVPSIRNSPALRAETQWIAGRVNLAVGEFERAADILREVIKHFDSGPERDLRKASLARIDLASTQFRLLDGLSAIALAQRAIADLEAIGHSDDLDLFMARETLAGGLKHSDRTQESIDLYEAILKDRIQLGSSRAEIGGTRYNLALALERRGADEDKERALQLMTQAVADRESAHGMSHVETINAVAELARMQKRAGRLIEAEANYRRALSAARGSLGGTHWRTIQTNFNLGSLLLEIGRLDEAFETMGEARVAFLIVHGPQFHQTIQAGRIVAERMTEVGQTEEALRLARRVLEQAGPLEQLDEAARKQAERLQELIARLSDGRDS